MDMNRIIAMYMDDCHSRQLRPKTMQSYEQALRLFSTWLEETHCITQVEAVKDIHIRSYINDLQTRGKYTFCINRQSEVYNHPQHRRDYQSKISNITINNYLRNIRAFFTWLVEVEYIDRSPMQKVRLLPDERSAREYLEDDEVIEGAILIFEEEAGPLFRLARDAEQHEAMSAMNDIGTALYELRQHVKQLQEAHRKEEQRQRGPQIPDNNNEK